MNVSEYCLVYLCVLATIGVIIKLRQLRVEGKI